MLIDLNHEKIREARYDVCVFGAGPAGITVARTLAAKGKLVALVEGGALEYSEESQSLYAGKSIGNEDWQAPMTCRLRYFGGASNHWGGRCGIFDPIDFESHEQYPLPGWPISRDTVLAYLPKALEIVDLPANALPNVPPSLGSSRFRWSEKALSRPPTRFGQKYLDEIKSSTRIHAYINANLVNMPLQENSDSLAGTEVRNFKGGTFVFTAKQYVLALGGIENARILLNADRQLKNGIGNHNGMVGRCFMDHLNLNFGRFVIEDELAMKRGMELSPSEAMMREHGIGSGVLSFEPNTDAPIYGRLRTLKKAARDTVCESGFTTGLIRKLSDFDCPGDGIISSMIEQSPNPDSRVQLDSVMDPFGLRRLKLDWRISDADHKTIRILGLEVAKELARMKIARVQLKDFMLDEHMEITGIGPHCHHMGTTRMSSDPRFGVVDVNSKVHGIANLHIAGSSVFPTSGGINPTLTIVMLSLRLGEHLSHLVGNNR